jgi:glucan phosphorylase
VLDQTHNKTNKQTNSHTTHTQKTNAKQPPNTKKTKKTKKTTRFQNKTNGVTPRRWLAFCNPELASLITGKLGSERWITQTKELEGLRKFADDKAFQKEWRAVKAAKKAKLAAYIKEKFGDDVNQNALFDIQVRVRGCVVSCCVCVLCVCVVCVCWRAHAPSLRETPPTRAHSIPTQKKKPQP